MLSLTSQLSGPFYGALPAKRGIKRILDLIHFPRKASDGSEGVKLKCQYICYGNAFGRHITRKRERFLISL